jgi:hypothetical protein
MRRHRIRRASSPSAREGTCTAAGCTELARRPSAKGPAPLPQLCIVMASRAATATVEEEDGGGGGQGRRWLRGVVTSLSTGSGHRGGFVASPWTQPPPSRLRVEEAGWERRRLGRWGRRQRVAV